MRQDISHLTAVLANSCYHGKRIRLLNRRQRANAHPSYCSSSCIAQRYRLRTEAAIWPHVAEPISLSINRYAHLPHFCNQQCYGGFCIPLARSSYWDSPLAVSLPQCSFRCA